METKAVFVINAVVNKDNMSELNGYLESVMPIFAKNNGKPIGRFKISESISGDEAPETVAILEFPSKEVIQEMVQGDEFKGLNEVRSRVFSKLTMMIGESL